MTAETAGVARITVEKGRAGAIGDSVFRTLTFFFALLVLLILGGVIVSLIAGAWPAFRTFGFGFIVNRSLEPGNRAIRGARPDLRHLGHLRDCDADRRAGRVWGGVVHHRDLPVVAEAANGDNDRVVGSDPQHHLRYLGPVCFCAVCSAVCSAGDHRHARQYPRDRRIVCRSAARHRHADRRFYSRDHGAAVYLVDHARRVRDGAADAEGERLRSRRHTQRGRLAGCRALHPDRRHRRHHAWPSDGRWARPWPSHS